ncbi:MAG: polysulfide reductase NrfD [Anaerolineae bacterium]|nr:polysulfide reductase NrfD [Anaerolineae bacterium]
MNYAFVIDNGRCIGCHACSTACKSENQVPLGVNRTWVKYVEAGVYPDARRHFQVTRCNHCANPPCVRICPVTAMYQRADGIVEFDNRICIGCKACMQACPYDAIYIDPDFGTAAKCHFCSHRLDLGLEPACVVVCPAHAIIAGDMDNPASEISRVLAANQVTVRKPEQGTAPKLFYVEGDDLLMHPTATERAPQSYMWADVIPLHASSNGHSHAPAAVKHTKRVSASGAPLRSPQPQGEPWHGPIQRGGSLAEHMVQVAYNAQHKIPWHWPVPAYLVTKGIGTGIFMLLALAWLSGSVAFDSLTFLVGGFISLLFIAITTGFLVLDLDRPERFLSILLHPQWKSWLARGAYLLVGFSTLAGIWWLLEVGAHFGWLPPDLALSVRPYGLWLGTPLAFGAAVYTAFLFGQAEGRDLWQSGLLPVHLVIQSFMVGSAALLLVGLGMQLDPALAQLARSVFFASLVLDLAVTLFGEFGMPHASEVAARAAHDIRRGRYKRHFWWGSLILGHLVPLALLAAALPLAAGIAAVCAVAGLYFYEYAFVMAPQDIPNS